MICKLKRLGAHHRKRVRQPEIRVIRAETGSRDQWLREQQHDLNATPDDDARRHPFSLAGRRERHHRRFRRAADVIKRHGLFNNLLGLNFSLPHQFFR
jgi:hypothetical protein